MDLDLEGDPAADGCVRWVWNPAGVWHVEVSATQQEYQANSSDQSLYIFTVEVLNNMSIPTDVHWHGLLPPNGQDAVGYLTEHPIMPNQTREYRFDQMVAGGMYWAHAHFEFQDAQGLAAPIVLSDSQAYLRAIGDPLDIIMMVEDRFRYNYCAYSPHVYPEHCAAIPTGNNRDIVHMLNRQVDPVQISVKPGQAVRLRVVNVGSEAPWCIDVSSLGQGEMLSLDGIRLERSGLMVPNKTLSTAQRFDLLVPIPSDASPACYPILATSLSHRLTLHKPPMRGILLSTGGQCPDIRPWANRTLDPPVNWNLDHEARAADPMKVRPVDVRYSLQFGGDQYGGFFLDCPEGLSMAACRDFKWGLPPHPVFRHNETGLQIHSRRPCAGCAQLQDFNDSGLILVNGSWRCWEWSDIPDEECAHFKRFLATGSNVQEDAAKMKQQALEVCKGQRVEIEFINALGIEPNEGHPMHLHGHTFEVRTVERMIDGHWEAVTTGNAMPHDTVHVPWGFKVVIQFDAINPGIWLLHCHNTMHLEHGMMTLVVYREDWHPRCRQSPQWKGNHGGLR
eukprot:TRINITY_DN123595_c0_g1_i1.p1 TRINITY_DN123595_c0_g1~~TRINITY_DN123595_c0_g1_i1.p1  ORF type:complete len:563 (+),score=44.64 TRINITY_DN123595_c0_g1_i1:470-2158(+)